jgi:hypothetical protein
MTWRILVPLALGLGAGLLNFVLIRGATTPLELVAVSKEVKAGEELKEDMLEKVSVRAPRELLASALLWSERGTILKARVARTLKPRELILGPDVRHELSDDIKNQLRPGEFSWTIIVRPFRLAPGLRQGDQVLVRAGGIDSSLPVKVSGPYRFLGLGEHLVPFHPSAASRDEFVKVALAIPTGKDGGVKIVGYSLDEITLKANEEKFAQSLAIEHFRPAPIPTEK